VWVAGWGNLQERAHVFKQIKSTSIDVIHYMKLLFSKSI
jgi:hypothetical protein